jgi:hypothetical protein
MKKIMRGTLALLYLAGAGAMLSMPAAVAHHSTSGLYHNDRVVELTGTVKTWRFTNPHPFLILQVQGPDGAVVEWDVSYGGAAVVHLRRQGYTADTFRTGDVIVVRGRPAIAEDANGLLIQGHPTTQDGVQVVEGGSMF